MPLPLFVSCQTGTEEDAAAELTAVLQPTMPVKTLQGQVLVTIDVAKLGGYDTVASLLSRLVQVDYVHALLASTALYTGASRGPLDSIQTAAAEVSPATLAAAVELWRAACRASSDAAAVEAATLPLTKLVFRCLGKRGGRRHDFSSDDAKRAAGRGLKAAAVGLSGSTRDYHFDVLTQVHCNRCWLGIRVNKHPMRAAAEASGGLPRQGRGDRSRADTSPQVAPSGTGGERRAAGRAAATVTFCDEEDTAASATAAATAVARHDGSCSTGARRDPTGGSKGARPPALLASWGRAHLRALGLERPRDARDAAAPLHEMSLAEQRARKQAEMQGVVQRIVRGSGGGSGGGGGGGLSRRGRKRLELAQLSGACGALGDGAESGAAAIDERGGEEGGGGERGKEEQAEKGGDEGEGDEGVGDEGGVIAGPIRFAEPSRDHRNKCEFHVGRDREGRPCLGFRLGEGQAADGEAVAPPEGISFVSPWMVDAAAAATAFLREAGEARPVWRSLTLRVQLVRRAAGGGRGRGGQARVSL